MITLPFVICSFTDWSASSRHWIDAPSGSRQSNRFELLVDSTIPAATAAFLMNSLCSSLHKAGTVSTHLIFEGTSLPICYFSFLRACCEINCKVCLTTSISDNYLPSTETAFVCICNKCILY